MGRNKTDGGTVVEFSKKQKIKLTTREAFAHLGWGWNWDYKIARLAERNMSKSRNLEYLKIECNERGIVLLDDPEAAINEAIEQYRIKYKMNGSRYTKESPDEYAY